MGPWAMYSPPKWAARLVMLRRQWKQKRQEYEGQLPLAATPPQPSTAR